MYTFVKLISIKYLYKYMYTHTHTQYTWVEWLKLKFIEI